MFSNHSWVPQLDVGNLPQVLDIIAADSGKVIERAAELWGQFYGVVRVSGSSCRMKRSDSGRPKAKQSGVSHPWPIGLNSAGKLFAANLAALLLPLILMGHSGLKDIKKSWHSKRPACYQTYISYILFWKHFPQICITSLFRPQLLEGKGGHAFGWRGLCWTTRCPQLGPNCGAGVGSGGGEAEKGKWYQISCYCKQEEEDERYAQSSEYHAQIYVCRQPRDSTMRSICQQLCGQGLTSSQHKGVGGPFFDMIPEIHFTQKNSTHECIVTKPFFGPAGRSCVRLEEPAEHPRICVVECRFVWWYSLWAWLCDLWIWALHYIPCSFEIPTPFMDDGRFHPSPWQISTHYDWKDLGSRWSSRFL